MTTSPTAAAQPVPVASWTDALFLLAEHAEACVLPQPTSVVLLDTPTPGVHVYHPTGDDEHAAAWLASLTDVHTGVVAHDTGIALGEGRTDTGLTVHFNVSIAALLAHQTGLSVPEAREHLATWDDGPFLDRKQGRADLIQMGADPQTLPPFRCFVCGNTYDAGVEGIHGHCDRDPECATHCGECSDDARFYADERFGINA